MLKQGPGKLNVKIKKQALNLSKKMTQRIAHQKKLGMGMESSLDLAGNQGIYMVNPDAMKEMQEKNSVESVASTEETENSENNATKSKAPIFRDSRVISAPA